MTEREMEDLLWTYPDKFLNEQLEQFQRQPSSNVGRADLIFTDRIGRLLVVELKRDTLERGAIAQLVDYYGMMKLRFPEKCVELMIVANRIPPERRLACEQYDVTPVEIPQKKFRDVAAEVGYAFKSETPYTKSSDHAAQASPMDSSFFHGQSRVNQVLPISQARVQKGWFYWISSEGRPYFLAFVNAKGSCSMRCFEAENGAFVRKDYMVGDYQESFSDYVRRATQVFVSRQPNLERDCKFQLPSSTLLELKRQVQMSSAASNATALGELEAQ